MATNAAIAAILAAATRATPLGSHIAHTIDRHERLAHFVAPAPSPHTLQPVVLIKQLFVFHNEVLLIGDHHLIVFQLVGVRRAAAAPKAPTTLCCPCHRRPGPPHGRNNHRRRF